MKMKREVSRQLGKWKVTLDSEDKVWLESVYVNRVNQRYLVVIDHEGRGYLLKTSDGRSYNVGLRVPQYAKGMVSQLLKDYEVGSEASKKA